MVIDFRSENANPKLQKIFVEVINQQQWFHWVFFLFLFLQVKKEKGKLH